MNRISRASVCAALGAWGMAVPAVAAPPQLGPGQSMELALDIQDYFSDGLGVDWATQNKLRKLLIEK